MQGKNCRNQMEKLLKEKLKSIYNNNYGKLHFEVIRKATT